MYDPNTLDALLRKYPELESQFAPSQSGWGPMFDETYRTQGDKDRELARQTLLSNILGFSEPMDLNREQWLYQIGLAQIENDYRARAGQAEAYPDLSYIANPYFMESPESAQQNALKYAWLEALATKDKTFNPHMQQATSFSPQFGGVYVDPFMKGNQEQGFKMEIPSTNPEMKRLGFHLEGHPEIPLAGVPEVLARNVSTGTLPEMPPEITDMKSFNKFMEKQAKEEATALEKQATQAQKQQAREMVVDIKSTARRIKEKEKEAIRAKEQRDKLMKQAQKEAVSLATKPKTSWDVWLTKQANIMGKLDNFKRGSRQWLELVTAIRFTELTKGKAAAEQALLKMIEKRQKQRTTP